MFIWDWLQLLDVAHTYCVVCVVFLHNEVMVIVTVSFFWGLMVIATRMIV
jgi:hypothetical protein